MKDFNKIKWLSCLQYFDVNNLFGLAMLQKLSVNNFEWIEDTFQFNEDFIKNYKEKSDKGYFLEVDVRYLERLHSLNNDLSFLSERMRIAKFKSLVANLHDETEYIHIGNLKQALYHKFDLKKVHRVIKFSQNTWLKPNIDMNADLRKNNEKIILKKDIFKLMNDGHFGKTMENVRKYNDIKL